MLQELSHYITNTMIAGVLPLDSVVHALVGLIITVILLKFRFKFWWTMLVVLLAAVTKEIYDSFSLNNNYDEHLLDLLATLAYPIILSMARFLKMSISESQEHSQ